MGVGDSIMAGISAVAGTPNFKALGAMEDSVTAGLKNGIKANEATGDSVKFSNFIKGRGGGSMREPASGSAMSFTKLGFRNIDGDPIPNAYKFRIASSDLRVLVIAVMQEKFKFSVTSEWEPFIPFNEGGGLVNELSQFLSGRSLVTRFSSRRIWKGTTPLKFSFTLKFEAVEDAFMEVVAPAMALAQMASPGNGRDVNAFGFDIKNIPLLVPPGPDPFGRNLSQQDLSSIAGFGGRGLKPDVPGEFISVTIGNRFVFDNVIVHSVTPEWDSRLDVHEYPISAEVHLELETYEIYTKQALMQSVV